MHRLITTCAYTPHLWEVTACMAEAIAVDAKGINSQKEEEMGRIILKDAVKREKGYMYYVDGKGNLCEAKMVRGGHKKKKAKK